MKKLIVLTFLLLLAGCTTSEEKKHLPSAHVTEVRQFVIEELEITDQSEITFINMTQPDIKEVNSILYYWFKDASGKAVYTVEAQPGKEFHIFTAAKN